VSADRFRRNDLLTDEIEKLVETLALEPLAADRFRGHGSRFGGARIFGGHLVAQALLAAYETVVGKACHSLSCTFIRAGDRETPVHFAVERVSDGGMGLASRPSIEGGRRSTQRSRVFEARAGTNSGKALCSRARPLYHAATRHE